MDESASRQAHLHCYPQLERSDVYGKILEGEYKKSSQNVLLNGAKLVNPTVKLQAEGQNWFSIASNEV